MKVYKCLYCGCLGVEVKDDICPQCHLKNIPPFDESLIYDKDMDSNKGDV